MDGALAIVDGYEEQICSVLFCSILFYAMLLVQSQNKLRSKEEALARGPNLHLKLCSVYGKELEI